jgi:hypothetical protein
MNKSLVCLSVGLPFIAAACVALVSEQEHPCPCSSQWVCCPSTNVCIPEGAACLPVDSGTPASDSAGSGEADSALGADSLAPTEASTDADGGFSRPAACANPGPFTVEPTAASLPSLIVGTWIECGNSWFEDAGVPIDELGIVVRPDGSWQKLGVSDGNLVPLTQHEDYGTWSIYGGGCCGEMLLLTWDTTGLATSVAFAVDGQSMLVTTSAGGNQAILAKVTDSVSDAALVEPDAADAAVPDAAADAATPDAADAASCFVYARDFDQSCTTDSDCQAVVLGGNVCDPCAQATDFMCASLASVNTGAYLTYLAAVGGAVSSVRACGSIDDCPADERTRCVSGVCKMVDPITDAALP